VGELRDQLAQHASQEHAILDGEGVLLRAQAPAEAELEHHYGAPGEPALLQRGVIYQGDWKRFGDGMARHVKDQALALATAGVPVWLQTINETIGLDGELDPGVVLSVGHLRHVTLSHVPIAIRHVIFRDATSLKAIVLPASARLSGQANQERVFSGTIVYTSWERDRIHASMAAILNQCGQIWVPCEANRKAFAQSGIDEQKLHVVPYPYDPTCAVCQIPAPRGSERVPSGKRFYAIGKWEPRKRLHELIGAFLMAFTPKDRASLLIKTHGWGQWSGYPSIEESIKHWSKRAGDWGWTTEAMNKRIRVIASKISEDEIVELHRQNNIYVSAGAGEAWDLPAFDAKCAGNRLVYVGFGGPQEYAEDSDVRVPWTDYEPVHPDYGWEPDAQWARVEIEQIAAALKKAKAPERRVHPPGFNLRYGRAAVGAKMRSLVLLHAESLCEGLGGEILNAGSFG
jgi:glycosyltransferase involved in cell wall biosynthesis